jgi:hypothetical protein
MAWLSAQLDSARLFDHFSLYVNLSQSLGHRDAVVSVSHEIDPTGMNQLYRG